jgi:hypothetical protein
MAMASSTEVELLRNQLSKKEEELHDLSVELNKAKQELQRRVREERSALTHQSVADELALASGSTGHKFLLVWHNLYHFPLLPMNDR